MNAPRQRGDRGETLIELLVAITLMATAIAVIMGGIATSVRISDQHRKQATAGASVRDFAEAIENRLASSATGYVESCSAMKATYEGVYTAPAGYVRSIDMSEGWNGSTGTFGACVDSGTLRRITLSVRSTDNRAKEELQLVIRKPCRPTDTPC
ncbi:prepilin-type N-terminal cleavage/methylation domain-containing protein [Luedemannella flava]|uniref:Prepilin-type N-terminal cleavage/methylation domain-containing protein n=1 Tax=Luedemannella flava TaxID=349316 RepID=A0ABN2MPN1_9ACTN